MRTESRMNHRWPAAALRLAALTVLLGLLVPLAACGQDMTPDERIEQAREYRAEGDRRAAIIELRNALQQEPDNAEARAFLGRLYIEAENMPSAEKELTRALELGHPREELIVDLGRALIAENRTERLLEEVRVDDAWSDTVRARVHALRGRAHAAEGDGVRAREALDRADEAQAGELQTYLGRIELAMRGGRSDMAQRLVDGAVDAYPESASAWRAAARVAIARDDVERAESAADRAIELSSRPAEDYLLRARLRVGRGDLDGARADLDALGSGARDHPRVLFVHSLVAWAEQDFETACTDLREVVADAPEYVEARYFLGACHYREGELNQAESHLRWVNQRASEPRVARLLAAVQFDMEQFERARQTIRPIVQQYPDDADALALLGRIEMRLGNTSEGLGHMQRLAELRPDDPAVQLQLGTGLMQTGQTGAGAEAFGQAMEIDPDIEGGGEMLVLTLLQAGEYGRAIEEARALAERRPESALPWTLMGLAYLAQDDADGAREALDGAIEREPADPAARHYLARLAVRDGDTEAARAHYRTVLDAHPEHVDTLLALAEIEAATGRPDRVRELTQRAHEADPDALRPRIMLARNALQRGDPDTALDVIAGPDDNVPQDPAALEIAGRALIDLGRPEQAIGHIESLIARQPGASGSHLLLARAYAAAGRGDEAVEQLDRVLELDPGNTQALVTQARVRILQGRDDEAREMLDRLPEDVADQPFVLETRAALAARADDPATAADYYRRMLDAAPSAATVVRLAQALRRAGESEAALAELDTWLEQRPGDADVWVAKGDMHLLMEREDRAIEAYRSALENSPDAVAAMNNLAWLLRERDTEQALRYAERAAELQPDNLAVRDTLGIVLLHDGRVDAAVEELRGAVEGAPDAPVLRFHLAQALAEAGLDDEARHHLRTALDTEVDFAERADAEALLAELED